MYHLILLDNIILLFSSYLLVASKYISDLVLSVLVISSKVSRIRLPLHIFALIYLWQFFIVIIAIVSISVHNQHKLHCLDIKTAVHSLSFNLGKVCTSRYL